MKTLLSLSLLFLPVCVQAAIPPPYQPNSFTTNMPRTPVQSQGTISVTNLGSATNWNFFGVAPRTVATLSDVSNVVTATSGNVTNALSIISSNGLVIASGVTNLDFSDGTNSAWKITNAPAGYVHVAAHVNPAVWINASNLTFQIATACSNLSYQIGAAASNLAYVIGANSTNYTDSRSVNLTNQANANSVAASNLSYTIGANGTNYTDSNISSLSNHINGAFIKNLNGLGTNTTIRSVNGGPSRALTVDTNVLVATNGSIGIGTDNPSRTLNVVNNSAAPARIQRSSALAIAGHMEMYNPDTTDGNSVSYDFLGDTTGAGASVGVAFGTIRNLLTIHDHATRAGDMLLMTLSPAGNLEKVRIKSGGQVGIGTNNPQARLHVIGDGTFTNLLDIGTTLTNDLVNVDTNGNVWAFTGHRRSTNAFFEDDEWVTEERLQAVVLSLEGGTFFLQTNAHPVVSGTLATRLTKQPTAQFLTNVLSAGSNQVAIWLSTNFVSSGVIPAGAYDMHIHARKTSAGPDVTIGFDVVRTNGAGITTLASGETNAIPSTTESDFLLSAHIDTPVTVSATDYIGVRYYAIRGGGAVSVISQVGGLTDSHFTTPNLTGGGGSTATAVSVSSNGVSVTTAATNLNFVNAPLMTNSSGNVSIDLATQPQMLPSLLVQQNLFDEFLYIAGSGTISTLPPFGFMARASGGSQASNGGETNAPGIWRILSGTTSGNSVQIDNISTSSGGYGPFALGQMAMTNQWRVRFNPMPTPGEGGKYVWGFGDTTCNVVFSDGAWIQVDTNRFNWVLLVASNSVVQGVTNTSTFPTNDTWYTLTITIDTAGTAAIAYVNGVSILTNSGNIPINGSLTARSVGLVAGVKKESGGSLNQTNDLDYCWLSYKLNAVR